MKYIIIVLLFCLSLFVGFYFYFKFDRRRKVFSALIMFAEKLSLEINFTREKLKVLIENFDKNSKRQLYGIDEVFLNYLDKKSELDLSSLKRVDCLKQEEKELVLLFLKTLGKSDVDNQTKEIQNFINRFSEIADKCKSDFKKYGSMSIKLSIVVGLFVVILLI